MTYSFPTRRSSDLDCVADIDRRTVLLDRQFDDLDRAIDTRAETARRGDHQLEDGFGGIAHGGPASTRLLARAKAASYEASHRVGPKRTAALRLLNTEEQRVGEECGSTC